MCDHLDFLEKVVKCNHRVEEHEQTLRHAKRILQLPPCLGFKILDTIVRYISDRATAIRGEFERGYRGDPVLCKFFLEDIERVDFRTVACAGLYDFARIYVAI